MTSPIFGPTSAGSTWQVSKTCIVVRLWYAIGERITIGLCIVARQMALLRRRPKAGLILHADRGSQYCAKAYQQLLSTAGIIASMSRRGHCYDNALGQASGVRSKMN